MFILHSYKIRNQVQPVQRVSSSSQWSHDSISPFLSRLPYLLHWLCPIFLCRKMGIVCVWSCLCVSFTSRQLQSDYSREFILPSTRVMRFDMIYYSVHYIPNYTGVILTVSCVNQLELPFYFTHGAITVVLLLLDTKTNRQRNQHDSLARVIYCLFG